MIKFCSKSDEYFEFSNFYRSPFSVVGKVWKTVEHFYQAAKFIPTDPGWAEEIRQAETPGEAKKLGRSEEHEMRSDWDEAKETIMRVALEFKFQDPELRRLLLSTEGQTLVEHAPWGDAYWGDNGDGTGLNRLGELLMELRERLLPESDADKE